jgi:type VI protein secretion system component Hcp
MTKSSSKRNLHLAVTVLFVGLAPNLAFAGGKGGGGSGKPAGKDRPTESVTLTYGKIEQNYTQKNNAKPNLYKNSAQGKHYSKGAQ